MSTQLWITDIFVALGFFAWLVWWGEREATKSEPEPPARYFNWTPIDVSGWEDALLFDLDDGWEYPVPSHVLWPLRPKLADWEAEGWE